MYPKLANFSVKVIAILTFVLIGAISHAQHSAPPPAKQVFVIVHGAWGGSWAFKKADSLLTASGSVVYRPSLTGLGERVHLASPAIDLNTHIQDVVNVFLYEELTEVILVGHSYGGMVITGVADRIPGRIRKLVYLDAMVPEDGESVMDLMDPTAEGISKMIKGDFVVPVWLKPDQKPPGDVPHPLRTFTMPINLENERRESIESVYVLTVDPGKNAAEDDFAFSAARAQKKGWTVITMAADHNPQWSAVDELVHVLLGLR